MGLLENNYVTQTLWNLCFSCWSKKIHQRLGSSVWRKNKVFSYWCLINFSPFNKMMAFVEVRSEEYTEGQRFGRGTDSDLSVWCIGRHQTGSECFAASLESRFYHLNVPLGKLFSHLREEPFSKVKISLGNIIRFPDGLSLKSGSDTWSENCCAVMKCLRCPALETLVPFKLTGPQRLGQNAWLPSGACSWVDSWGTMLVGWLEFRVRSSFKQSSLIKALQPFRFSVDVDYWWSSKYNEETKWFIWNWSRSPAIWTLQIRVWGKLCGLVSVHLKQVTARRSGCQIRATRTAKLVDMGLLVKHYFVWWLKLTQG